MQAQITAGEGGIGAQAHPGRHCQLRGKQGEIVRMQAQLHLALVTARDLQGFVHQCLQQGRIGGVFAAEQSAGNPHGKITQGIAYLRIQPRQRPGEGIQDAFHLGGDAADLRLSGRYALGVAAGIAFGMRGLFDGLQLFHAGHVALGLLHHRRRWCQLGRSPAHRTAHTKTSAFAASWMVPSSAILRKTGMKQGMALGLFVMAVGAFVFGQYTTGRVYAGAVTGVFIIGAGLAILQTASNPYISILGPLEGAAQRIAVMGICNKLAGMAAQSIRRIIISNAEIAAAGWPGPPKNGDLVIIDSRPYRLIDDANTQVRDDVVVAHFLTVKGGPS